MPAATKLFYEIYKVMYQSQLLFNSIKNPNALKNMLIDFCLTDKQRELMEALSEEHIAELASAKTMDEVAAHVKGAIEQLMSSFDIERIKFIDRSYGRLMALRNFACYDYYFLLKKINSMMREGDFSSVPRFPNVSGEYILEDMKDFISVAWALPLDDDWNTVCEFIKTMKQIDVLPAGTWRKVLARLRSVRASRIFELMVKHISKDPFFETNVREHTEAVIDGHLNKVRDEANRTVERLRREQKDNKSGSLMTEIFGTAEVFRLKNYTEQNSAVFEKRGVGSFKYWQPLSCLKAFLVDFVKRDVREYADLVLVRGTWTTVQLSIPMSDAYHDLIEASDKISDFDNRVGEDGDLGIKLKNLMPRVEREREVRNIMATTINDINGFAKEFIIKSYKDLVTFAKNTKMLMDDHAKPHADMIDNWKEVERFAEHDVQEMGITVYKKIYTFAQLMQNFLSA